MQFLLARVLYTSTTLTVMKSASKSITFTPSDTISQQLEEFARVAGVTPDKMVSDILDVQFGPDHYIETLRQYIYDRGNGIRKRRPKSLPTVTTLSRRRKLSGPAGS
jgi:hypothetical protein